MKRDSERSEAEDRDDARADGSNANAQIAHAVDELVDGWIGSATCRTTYQARNADTSRCRMSLTAGIGSLVRIVGTAGDARLGSRWAFQRGDGVRSSIRCGSASLLGHPRTAVSAEGPLVSRCVREESEEDRREVSHRGVVLH